jgi:N-acetylglucosamine-6-phosphate deacetylase
MITHLFNAMPTFHHRDPGLVGLLGMTASSDSKDAALSSVAEDQRPHYGLIADGYHAHPASVKAPLSCICIPACQR